MSWPVVATLLLLVLLLVGEAREHATLQRIAKLGASAGFLATAWQAGALDHDFGRVMFAALVLCAIGDACLLSRAKPWFLAGLVAFALGHLGYAGAFVGEGIAWGTAAVLGAILLVPEWIVWRWLGPHIPADMRVPVIAYIAIITTMMTCAWTCDAGAATWSLRIGATAFYLSDLSVARDVFVQRAFVNRLWGLPAYYVAQLVLASAAGT
jgi:uncharacterized membrane protein YhhN